MNKAVCCCFFVTALFFYALLSVLHGAVNIDVTPRSSMAPARIQVKTHVDVDPADRWLDVAIGAPEGYGAESLRQIDTFTPPTQWFEYRDVPAGHYTAQLTVYGANGKQIARATQQFRIAGDE